MRLRLSHRLHTLLVFLPCCRHCAHPRRRCYRVTNIAIPSHTIRDRLLLIKNYHFTVVAILSIQLILRGWKCSFTRLLTDLGRYQSSDADGDDYDDSEEGSEEEEEEEEYEEDEGEGEEENKEEGKLSIRFLG